MITIDLTDRLSPELRLRIIDAAVRDGINPEDVVKTAILRALEVPTASRASYRLRMPDHARKKLEEHALALGCDPGELALFLLRRKRGETVELSG